MPYDYLAPVREMRFIMERVLRAPASWHACGGFDGLDMATVESVLEEASRFSREVLLPLNAGGDAQGCVRADDGSVRTPAGFAQAYAAFVQGGWPALPCSPDWGGQGLPLLLDAAVREMLDACNHGWNMYPDLLHGAYETLKAHGSPALKDRYLGDLVSGCTLAAMALTEPGAGSDLGVLRTKAEPVGWALADDGSAVGSAPVHGMAHAVRVTGSKIFISGGEHDLTSNIVHLVLCRLPGAPEGTRGISLALVPKVLPDGSRNAMVCEGLEHKMGIHGSATCSMRYEGALGWLVGQPHRGLAAMFLMMNSARLHVGLQGLGHLEMATQNAVRWAQERVQGGRSIIHHPAMRHTLMRLRATTEALRCVAYRAALALDEAEHHPEAPRRAGQAALAALLTPIVKALGTAQGFEGASRALQVFGGYGYVRETGVEQSVRDARIAMIYEGTNEIQAIDLVQRKLLADGGRALEVLLAECESEIERLRAMGATLGEASTQESAAAATEVSQALVHQVGRARRGLAALVSRSAQGREALLAVCDDAMLAMGHLAMAWAWASMLRASLEEWVDPAHEAGSTPHAQLPQEGRIRHCLYGAQWLLPLADAHWSALESTRSLPELQT